MRIPALLATVASLSLLVIAAGSGPSRTDEDGFILNWLVLEPIPVTNLQHTETGVRTIVSREDFKSLTAALPKVGEKFTADGASYEWRTVDSKKYLISLTGFAAEFKKPMTSVVFYGVAYINVPQEMKEARLSIGSDDDSVWWVNGKEVISAYGVRQTSTDDNVSRRLTLNKGVNVLRFAVVQGDGPSDCCARFFDSRQQPITNLTVSLSPPPASR